LVRLAERLGAPVATSYHALDAFPSAHRLGLGALGPCGRAGANAIARQADVVVDVGGALDFYTTRYDRDFVPEGARIIQLVETPEQVGAAFPAAAGVVGNLRQAVDELAALAARRPLGDDGWLRRVGRARAEQWSEQERALAEPGSPGRIRPEFLMATLNQALDPDDV